MASKVSQPISSGFKFYISFSHLGYELFPCPNIFMQVDSDSSIEVFMNDYRTARSP